MLNFKASMLASIEDAISPFGGKKLIALHNPLNSENGQIYAQQEFNSVFWIEYWFKPYHMMFWVYQKEKGRTEYIAAYSDGPKIRAFLDAIQSLSNEVSQ